MAQIVVETMLFSLSAMREFLICTHATFLPQWGSSKMVFSLMGERKLTLDLRYLSSVEVENENGTPKGAI